VRERRKQALLKRKAREEADITYKLLQANKYQIRKSVNKYVMGVVALKQHQVQFCRRWSALTKIALAFRQLKQR